MQCEKAVHLPHSSLQLSANSESSVCVCAEELSSSSTLEQRWGRGRWAGCSPGSCVLGSTSSCWDNRIIYSIKFWHGGIQQQQQQSLLSQASWDRLEMKPKRHKGHGSGTLIASLQALISKTNSEISQSLRSLLTDSSQVSLGLPLPLFTLSTHFRTPLRTDA